MENNKNRTIKDSLQVQIEGNRSGERTPKFKKLLKQKFMQENQVSSILEHTANKLIKEIDDVK